MGPFHPHTHTSSSVPPPLPFTPEIGPRRVGAAGAAREPSPILPEARLKWPRPKAARGEKDRDELQCLELLPFAPSKKYSLPTGQLALLTAPLENEGELKPRLSSWASEPTFRSFVLLRIQSPTSLVRLFQPRPGRQVFRHPGSHHWKVHERWTRSSNPRSATPSLTVWG